ncbi:uncharacterized protein LOC112348860 isoform X3 [Selaginella moellendorffii]|uniref:uncharacterized protein LOC112348860 isoform X3 n=1 Tax=Selaginella moellendorffii TaxID=88036 RepID=UPI000D1CA9D1|nr:uncharacterized protein LOC112348860 isoform X3 [Selaginella moellendorffii]|eukprot:XP_024537925.1 uncharacterized protein LOC112348860 isoform X3 [Selaginella moellendorffii]
MSMGAIELFITRLESRILLRSSHASSKTCAQVVVKDLEDAHELIDCAIFTCLWRKLAARRTLVQSSELMCSSRACCQRIRVILGLIVKS